MFLRHWSSVCSSAEPNVPEFAAASCPLVVSKEKKENDAVQGRIPIQFDYSILTSISFEVVRQRPDASGHF
jgi:hypothetical protein